MSVRQWTEASRDAACFYTIGHLLFLDGLPEMLERMGASETVVAIAATIVMGMFPFALWFWLRAAYSVLFQPGERKP